LPDEWVTVARDYFLSPDNLTYEHLRLAYRVTKELLEKPDFSVDIVFAKLDSEAIEDRFGGTSAAFDDCDPLGKMIKRWYPFLDVGAKLQAFRRLCRVAIFYHRYAVMGAVRSVFSMEKDEALRVKLLEILDKEDPSKVIHGKGVIPR
jgi:hypothetical protein